ncbi:MAG: hypothetical protein AB1791_18875 [Chloroflexota bacterium]
MITKRQLGLGLSLIGLLGGIVLFALDWVGASQFQGIGPTQRILLGAAGLLFLVGLSLIPLGQRPA